MITSAKRRDLLAVLMFFPLSAAILSFILAPLQARAQEISIADIGSQAAVLMEFSRGEIIFSQNGSQALPPASLTKIMTLVLAYESLQKGRVSWEEEVIISQKAWETGGSQMFLEIGQHVPFGELVTGIASISANDACVAVAEHLYGSEELFVQEMNKKAAELGLKNTQFQNSSGLPDPGHYSSAEDMAHLARYLIVNFPEYLHLHAQKEFTFNNIKQYNRNPLLGRFNGADGLKTGHTSEAGYCLIGTASQKGMRFITVVMKASSDEERLKDTENMLNYAFRNFTLHEAFKEGEILAAMKVSGGERRTVDLRLAEPLKAVIPFDRQKELKTELNLPQSVTAPVSQGDALGSARLLLEYEVIAESPLVAAEDINKAGAFSLLLRSLGDFFASLWQKIVETLGNLFR